MEARTDEERQEVAQRIANSQFVLDKLKTFIEHRFIEAAQVNRKDYMNSSWAYEQAHRNGKLEALDEIYQILPQ